MKTQNRWRDNSTAKCQSSDAYAFTLCYTDGTEVMVVSVCVCVCVWERSWEITVVFQGKYDLVEWDISSDVIAPNDIWNCIRTRTVFKRRKQSM